MKRRVHFVLATKLKYKHCNLSDIYFRVGHLYPKYMEPSATPSDFHIVLNSAAHFKLRFPFRFFSLKGVLAPDKFYLL